MVSVPFLLFPSCKCLRVFLGYKRMGGDHREGAEEGENERGEGKGGERGKEGREK